MSEQPTAGDALAAYGPELSNEIFGAFSGRLRPVEVSSRYRLAVLSETAMMGLLAIAYIGLVVLVGWATLHFAIQGVDLLWSSESLWLRPIRYLGPLFAGLLMVVALLKPLLAPALRRSARSGLEVTENDEPLLFAFVARICQEVGAPMPSRIVVDLQVRASASVGGGLASLATPDLVLILGMPLIRGLSLEQLAGVLAHELGHFAQGAGIRLNVIVHRIDAWFVHAIYRRDAWDQQLDDAARHALERSLFIWCIVQMARAAVWCARRILWVLMQIGHVVSSFLQREREFDADRYSTRLVGADTVRATLSELALLNAAQHLAVGGLRFAADAGRLVDDLPRLVVAYRNRIDEKRRAEIEAEQLDQRTGLFDSHPCVADRVANAFGESDPGVFHVSHPATALFRNADRLSCGVTREFIEARSGGPADDDVLIDADELLERVDRAEADQRAFDRVIGVPIDFDRLLNWPTAAPPADVETLTRHVAAARQRVLAERPLFRQRLRAWQDVVERLLDMDCAETALFAGLTIDADAFGLEGNGDANLAMVLESRQQLEQRARALDLALAEHEADLAERFAVALAAFDLDALTRRHPQLAAMKVDRDRLSKTVRSLSAPPIRLLDLRRTLRRIQTLEGHGDENDEAIIESLASLRETLQQQLTTMRDQWDRPYPFTHRVVSLPLGLWIVDAPPGSITGRELDKRAKKSGRRGYDVYDRLLARLATLVELAENALGFEPTDAPADLPTPS